MESEHQFILSFSVPLSTSNQPARQLFLQLTQGSSCSNSFLFFTNPVTVKHQPHPCSVLFSPTEQHHPFLFFQSSKPTAAAALPRNREANPPLPSSLQSRPAAAAPCCAAGTGAVRTRSRAWRAARNREHVQNAAAPDRSCCCHGQRRQRRRVYDDSKSSGAAVDHDLNADVDADTASRRTPRPSSCCLSSAPTRLPCTSPSSCSSKCPTATTNP